MSLELATTQTICATIFLTICVISYASNRACHLDYQIEHARLFKKQYAKKI